MKLEEILPLIEEAKSQGKESITVNVHLSDRVTCDLEEEHDCAIYFSGKNVLEEITETTVSWNEEKVASSKFWAKCDGWHYQVIYFPGERAYYGLHEVYVDKEGNIMTRTARPFTTGDDLQKIKNSLKMMIDDIGKYGVVEDKDD